MKVSNRGTWVGGLALALAVGAALGACRKGDEQNAAGSGYGVGRPSGGQTVLGDEPQVKGNTQQGFKSAGLPEQVGNEGYRPQSAPRDGGAPDPRLMDASYTDAGGRLR
jgi:hypothetical protein